MRPLVLIENDRALFDRTIEDARRDGWSVERGFDLVVSVPEGGRLVCTGEIATLRDAELAVLAVVRGAGLIAFGTAPRDVLDQMSDDLRRLGPLRHLTAVDERPTDALSDEQRAILDLLGAGMTLGQASQQLHLSRRTADRRLAQARKLLGVRTTAEAIAALDPPPAS